MKKLTDAEWNLLDKIATKTKMDCWFLLQHNNMWDADYVMDMENEEVISLRDGILQMEDGLSGVVMDFLTQDEIELYIDIVRKAQAE